MSEQPTKTNENGDLPAGRDAADAPRPDDDTSIAAAHARARKRAARARVLFADGDAETRDYVRRLLEVEYDVTCARDGAEALELVAVDPPDLVLADAAVPTVDGFGLLAAIRSDERTTSIPVILLSALEEADARAERLLAEADDYVLEPFSARELLARVGGAIALARTRTDLARREAELKAETTMILESISEAFVAVDAEWRIVYWNAQAERAHRKRREEMIGRIFWEAFPEATGTSFEQEFRRAMGSRMQVRVEGRYDPLDGWFEIDVYPIPNGGLALYFKDVTEQRNAARALAYNERRYRSLVEATTSVVWSTDGDGAIVVESPSWGAFTGQTREEYAGWGWSLAIHPDDRERTADVWRRALHARSYYQTAYRLQRHDGVYRHVVARGVPVLDEDGALVEWIGTCTDVDDQKRIEDELKIANRRKDEFIAILAHELRNPLAPIRNGLEVLRMAGDEREPVAAARAMMERQLAQMVRLVDELLDLSRISRGTIELHREECDLADVVASAVETSRPLLDQMAHELAVHLPEETILVDADATRLAQVFANLLNNAAKYTERGGRVSIAVEARDDEVAIRVEDTGVGIPPEMLARVFDMFTQVDRSLERAQGGLGIGLSVAKRLVEMHGGRIDVSSEGRGRGSAFTVVVPRVARTAARATVAASDGDARAAERRRVLVADDNVDAVTSLAMMLEIVGHEVRIAHDGLEAIELAREYEPDTVLLDIGMPGLNGYDACRRIRETAWGRGALLVALTGWGQEEDKRQARDAGFDHHLVKPLDFTALQKILAAPRER